MFSFGVVKRIGELYMDSIGKKPVFREESTASVPVVYRAAQKRWLISLNEPLRDEK